MATRRHFSKAEIWAILKEKTASMTPADIETLARILDYLTFAELARVTEAIKIIRKGGTY